MLKPSVQALRPHQWVKNLLVLAPLLFKPERMSEPDMWLQSLLAFAAFCMASSWIYLLNDIVDRAEDQHHPKKRLRPIASGALPLQTAYLMLVVLLIVAWPLLVLRLLDSVAAQWNAARHLLMVLVLVWMNQPWSSLT